MCAAATKLAATPNFSSWARLRRRQQRSRQPARFWAFRDAPVLQQEFRETVLRVCEPQRFELRHDRERSKLDSTALKSPLRSPAAKGPPARSAALFPDTARIWSRVAAVQHRFGRGIPACVASMPLPESRPATTGRPPPRLALSRTPAQRKCRFAAQPLARCRFRLACRSITSVDRLPPGYSLA